MPSCGNGARRPMSLGSRPAMSSPPTGWGTLCSTNGRPVSSARTLYDMLTDAEIKTHFLPSAQAFGRSDETADISFAYPPASWRVTDIGKFRVESAEGGPAVADRRRRATSTHARGAPQRRPGAGRRRLPGRRWRPGHGLDRLVDRLGRIQIVPLPRRRTWHGRTVSAGPSAP